MDTLKSRKELDDRISARCGIRGPGLWLVLLVGLTSVVASAPVWAGGIAIVNSALTDDGDGDGYADTRETVELRLTVRNTSGTPLNQVVATLTNRARSHACLTTPTVVVGNLATDEERVIGPFVFIVTDIDRATLGLGPHDELTAVFDVSFEAAFGAQPPAVPSTLMFDLDLDVMVGSGSTTFFESFEGSLGSFEIMNIDAGKHSREASEGYRCQQTDPATGCYTCDPDPCFWDCYLGATALQADDEFWGLSGPGLSSDDGRAFSGLHSLYFGIDLGPPENWTTPLAVLEAVATAEPINVGWDEVAPVLSFVQQASFFDSRTNAWLMGPVDRGIAMAQFADDEGDPEGPWFKLQPFQNTYDQAVMDQVEPGFCLFDPIDDDTVGDACDCNASDPGAFGVPPEVTDLRLTGDTLEWTYAVDQSGPGTRYELLRGDTGELPVGSGVDEVCAGFGVAGSLFVEPDAPGIADAFFYLIRGVNSCGAGTYGYGTGGERVSFVCP